MLNFKYIEKSLLLSPRNLRNALKRAFVSSISRGRGYLSTELRRNTKIPAKIARAVPYEIKQKSAGFYYSGHMRHKNKEFAKHNELSFNASTPKSVLEKYWVKTPVEHKGNLVVPLKGQGGPKLIKEHIDNSRAFMLKDFLVARTGKRGATKKMKFLGRLVKSVTYLDRFDEYNLKRRVMGRFFSVFRKTFKKGLQK